MTVSDDLVTILTFFVAIGSGLMGGLFFAFSNFVMKALGRVDPKGAIAAMQSINVVIINPVFLVLFLGSTLASLFLLVLAAFFRPPELATTSLLAGCAVYILGSFFVTMGCNVPRNNRLDRVDAAEPGAVDVWRDYIVSWTRWNHVRTVTSLAAAVLLTYSLWQMNPMVL